MTWFERLQTDYVQKNVTEQVNRLFAVYRNHTGHEPMAGGAQNIIMKHERSNLVDQIRKAELFLVEGRRLLRFRHLPLDVKRLIFAYLSPNDLCQAAQVCREWTALADDELLWTRILERRSRRWRRIHHERNPDVFRRVRATDLSSKRIYLRCHENAPPTASFRLPSLLQQIVAGKPRLVMFGPGLETNTSSLLRSILTDHKLKDLNDAAKFHVTGLMASEFAGVGSGISIKLGENSFNLITLYSNTKSVRRQQQQEGNPWSQNKLFRQNQRNEFEVTAPVRELLKRSHGFVFVVDVSRPLAEVGVAQNELSAMMCELWSSKSAPLLVLACHRSEPTSNCSPQSRASPIDVVRALRLGRINTRKWLVQAGDADSLNGVGEGFRWLLDEVGYALLRGV